MKIDNLELLMLILLVSDKCKEIPKEEKTDELFKHDLFNLKHKLENERLERKL